MFQDMVRKPEGNKYVALVPAKARAEQVLAMTLAVATDAVKEPPPSTDFGRNNGNRRYKRILSTVTSQVKRLCSHGILRKKNRLRPCRPFH